MTPRRVIKSIRLKYAATINDEALGEETAPDFELQYVDIGNVDSSGSIQDIATFRFEGAPSRARRIVRDGDIVISTVRTYLQAIAPIQNPPENLIVSTGFAVVRPKADRLTAAFCKYCLREPRFLAEVEMRSVGISYPAINASELGDIFIALPDIETQDSIAEILNRETERIDQLVAAKEQLMELIAEKRRALITHAVTRGLDPKASLRDSGLPWLGQIPAHWRIGRCAWLFKERDERGEPDLPLLEVSINSGVILREFAADRIESTAADFTTYKVARQGDLTFNKMRMWQGAAGIAPVDGLVSPDYTVAAIDGQLTQQYIAHLMRTGVFSAECARGSHGITWDRLRLYWDGFREIRIPLPPREEQADIVTWIQRGGTKLDALGTATERTIALLKERRGALIAAAVTGQLDILEVA